MTLLNPAVLLHLLWIIPLILIFYFIGAARSKRLTAHLRKYSELSVPKRVLRLFLLCGAVVFLALAAARPAWGKRSLPELPPGRDVMVLLDISKSMLSDNVRPTRLAHAKMILTRLTENLSGDRFGLIAFAGNADLVCPLSADRNTFLNKLETLSPANAKRGGTNLERALETALLALNGSAASRNRAVLIVSDGGELEGSSAKLLAQYQQEKIPVFALGIGEKNTPALIPLPGAGLLKDRNGNTVNAPLEDAALRKIAAETGGLYLQSTTLQDGVAPLTAELRRKLSPEAAAAAFEPFRKMEHPALPLTAALVCLILFFLISERRALTLILLFAAASLAGVEKSEALTAYEDALSLQKEGKTEDAAAQYSHAVSAAAEDLQIRVKSYLNLGVLEHGGARADVAQGEQFFQTQNLDGATGALDTALKKLDIAEENYRESLRSMPEQNPDAPAAVKNQTILLKDRKAVEQRKKEIEELKKKQEQAQQAAQNAKDQQEKQEKQNPENSASAAQQAQKAAEDFSDAAEKSGQKQMAEQARQAAEQLKNAQEQQKKGDRKAAEESIREAMRKLGMKPDGKPEQEAETKQDGQKPQEPQKPQKQPAEVRQDGRKQDNQKQNDGDEVEMMRRANEDFRNDLEKRSAAVSGSLPVEKDW